MVPFQLAVGRQHSIEKSSTWWNYWSLEPARSRTWNLLIRSQARCPLRHKPRILNVTRGLKASCNHSVYLHVLSRPTYRQSVLRHISYISVVLDMHGTLLIQSALHKTCTLQREIYWVEAQSRFGCMSWAYEDVAISMTTGRQMWNASLFCVSSLRRANLLCLVLILVHVFRFGISRLCIHAVYLFMVPVRRPWFAVPLYGFVLYSLKYAWLIRPHSTWDIELEIIYVWVIFKRRRWLHF